jgi:hypothetical protein
VAGAQVAVDHTGGVRLVQGPGDVCDERHGLAFGQRSLSVQPSPQAAARRVLHDDERHSVGGPPVVDGDQRSAARGRLDVPGQQFDHDRPVQPAVDGAPHHTGAARADLLAEQVTVGDHGPCLRHHRPLEDRQSFLRTPTMASTWAI